MKKDSIENENSFEIEKEEEEHPWKLEKSQSAKDLEVKFVGKPKLNA